MARLVQFLFIISFGPYIALAQVPGIGKCPDVTVQSNFSLQEYMGEWYEITKFYTSFENGQKCNRANYTLLPNGHVNVFNIGIDVKTLHEVNATGDGYSPDPDEKAKLKIKFSEAAPYADYWVLDTDYHTYTLIYSCIDLAGISHLEFSWILSRKPTLSDDIRERLYNKMESYKIKTKNYKDDDQTNCPFPVSDSIF